MKKIILCLVSFNLLHMVVCAQTNTVNSSFDNSDIDIVQSLFGKTKRLIIEEYIPLNDQEQALFWNIYDQYEGKRKLIEKERFLLLKAYADNYETLDATKASELARSFMNNTEKYNELHKTYFRKVEKAIGGLKAATFIQVETFIQTALQSELQSQVPVIGELERTRQPKAGQKIENLN